MKSVKILYIPLHILFACVLILSIFVNNKDTVVIPVEAISCPTGCYPNNSLNVCTGVGGCRNSFGCACTSGEFCVNGTWCCDNCDYSCGTCGSCTPPACPTYYSETNTGCATSNQTCTRYDSCGSCGTTTRSCWLVTYTLSYTAGSGGTISGTPTQSICRGSNGTQVTATPNAGYVFTQWSDGVLTASRTDTNVTANISVSASFAPNNQAPSAPTSLQANNSTDPIGIVGTPVFNAIFQDPNTGNTATYYQIQVNTASGFNGTSMWDSGQTQLSPSLAIGARMPNKTYAGSSLTEGATYYWRIRFTDNYGAVGTWSSTAQFTMNTTPSAPTALLTNGNTNPSGLTVAPNLRAQFNDPNATDTGTYYQIQVNTTSGFNGTTMWDSGSVGISPAISNGSSIPTPGVLYSGTALTTNGATYYWRIRFTDNYGTVGNWSSTAQFTMNTTPLAPTSLYAEAATNPTNVIDMTPEFSAIFNDPDTGDTATAYQVDVNTASNFLGTSMWSGSGSITPVAIGARSPDISYAGTTLTSNGATYYWRIRFTDNHGTVGAWSSVASFTMQGAPTTPQSLLTDGMVNPNFLYNSEPTLSAIYVDPNNHNATAYQIQVNTASAFNGTTMWDSTKLSTSIVQGQRSPNYQYAGTALVTGNRYYWRIKFWDTDDLEGAWSDTATFLVSYNRQYFKGLRMQGLQLR